MKSNGQRGNRVVSGAKTPTAVGYGRPPTEHQFQKGTSGNPLGRPRKHRQTETTTSFLIDDYMRAEFYRTIAVRENNKEVQLPAIQIAFRSLALQAAKGNTRAHFLMAKLLTEADQRTSDNIASNVSVVLEYQLKWEAMFRDYDEAGKPRPEVVPHPDDIAIHPRTGEIIFNGPFDKGDKAGWDKLIRTRDDFAEENELIRQDRRMATTDKEREFWDREMQHSARMIAFIDQTLPSEAVRRAPGFNIHEWHLKQPLLQAEIALRRKRKRKPALRR